MSRPSYIMTDDRQGEVSRLSYIMKGLQRIDRRELRTKQPIFKALFVYDQWGYLVMMITTSPLINCSLRVHLP